MLLLIPLTLAGFFKTYFGQIPNFDEKINTYIHLHAFIAFIWIIMLIVQPLLILNKKFKAHRKLGKFSYFLFPLLILSFIPQMVRIINSDHPEVLFFPLADSILLVVFYSLAIYNRKKAPKHMRFMIATAIVFLGPTIGRIGPFIFGWSDILTQTAQYVIIYSILVGLIIYDKRNNKDHKPFQFGLFCFLIHQVVFYIIFL